MDVLFPYALWTLVSLILIGSGIALLVWWCPPTGSERVHGWPPQSLAELIERMDRIHDDVRDLIAESRRLRAANRRLLAQIQSEHGHEQ
jgi:hypothetical protein